MNKVFQTIVSKGRGDCERAAIASLLELDITDVPHFNLFGENWGIVYANFIQSMGFTYWGTGTTKRHDLSNTTVDGLIIAGVPSLTFADVHHAVIVHADSAIVVHDPNPNERWLGKNVSTSIKDWALIEVNPDSNPTIYDKEDCDHAHVVSGTLPNSNLQSTWCYDCCSVIRQGVTTDDSVVYAWDTQDDILITMT